MKLSKLAHTKNAEVLLSPAMCVAIADAEAKARGQNIPADSPAFHRGTQKALIRRGVFRGGLKIVDKYAGKKFCELTPYGTDCVDIAIWHYNALVQPSARARAKK